MTGEVEFSSLTKEDVKIKLEQPDRVPRRPSDEEVAKHRKTRVILVVFFGLVVLAMVVAAVIIIIVSPKCAKAGDGGDGDKDGNVTTTDGLKEWWRGEIVYQIYPRSFKDSSGDGNGDLKGILEKINHFKDIGVKIVRLSPIYKPTDFKDVDTMFGTMQDFDDLLKKAHEMGVKIVLDFVPNYTSDEHPWFVDSKNPKGTKRDWYIWREGNDTHPPTNWASVDGGSAWEREGNSSYYYLHQFSKEQPDLNLRNAAVVDSLKDAMKFWLDKGIDGFALEKVQFLLEEFKDEERTALYNKSLPLKYNMLVHKYTHDLSGNQDIVKNFQELIANYSGTVLMAEVTGSPNRTAQYYKVCDFPYNIDLIPTSSAKSLSRSISDSVSGSLKNLPKGKSPNWLIGSQYKDRVGADLIKAMNVLLLTLPGTPSTYYGEEIGLVNANTSVSPMQWSAENNAGFTSSKPWKTVSASYKTVNVAEEQTKNGSVFSLYKKLVELRTKEAFNSSDFVVVHVDNQIMAYTRGDHAYLMAINFSDQLWDGDLDKLSGRGKVVVDTEGKDVGKTVDVNKIKLNFKQALVVELHPEHTMSS